MKKTIEEATDDRLVCRECVMDRTFEIRLRTLHPNATKPCGVPQHPNARAGGFTCDRPARFNVRPRGFAGTYDCCLSCPSLLLDWLYSDMLRNAAAYDAEQKVTRL